MRVKNPWYEYAREDYNTIKALAGKKLTRSVLFVDKFYKKIEKELAE